MIDAQTALRLHLLETSDLTTLVGVHVYWPELPANVSMPRKAVTFRFNGGSADPDIPMHRYTVNFRCWGETAYDAFKVYRELHDRLVRDKNRIVTDTFASPDEYVAFYNFTEVTPGQPLEDPGTGWPYTFCVWTVTVSTLGVPEPSFVS